MPVIKLTAGDVSEMRDTWSAWKSSGLVRPGANPPKSIKHLARDYGISPDYARAVVKGKERK